MRARAVNGLRRSAPRSASPSPDMVAEGLATAVQLRLDAYSYAAPRY